MICTDVSKIHLQSTRTILYSYRALLYSYSTWAVVASRVELEPLITPATVSVSLEAVLVKSTVFLGEVSICEALFIAKSAHLCCSNTTCAVVHVA